MEPEVGETVGGRMRVGVGWRVLALVVDIVVIVIVFSWLFYGEPLHWDRMNDLQYQITHDNDRIDELEALLEDCNCCGQIPEGLIEEGEGQ